MPPKRAANLLQVGALDMVRIKFDLMARGGPQPGCMRPGKNPRHFLSHSPSIASHAGRGEEASGDKKPPADKKAQPEAKKATPKKAKPPKAEAPAAAAAGGAGTSHKTSKYFEEEAPK